MKIFSLLISILMFALAASAFLEVRNFPDSAPPAVYFLMLVGSLFGILSLWIGFAPYRSDR